jgi:hypothetical protein
MIEEESWPAQDYAEVPLGGAVVPFRFDDPGWLKVQFLDGNEVINLDHDPDATDELHDEYTFRVRYAEMDGGDTLVPHVVTYPPLPEGQTLRVSRVTPLEQPLELAANAPLPARALERALDRLTMALQDQRAENGSLVRNVLTFPPGEPVGFRTQLPPATGRAGHLLGFHRQTGELELVDSNQISVEAARTQLANFVDEVSTLRHETEISLQQTSQTAPQGFFYRDPGNDGMKFGEIGNPDLLELSQYKLGPQSMTIQSGTDSMEQRAKGERSIAIGYGTHADAVFAVSIGSFAQAWGGSAVALGHDAVARGSESVAVGRSAYAELNTSVAVGPWAKTPVVSEVPGHGCVAVGFMTEAGGVYGTAVGAEALAAGSSSLAVGTRAAALGTHQTSVGHEAGSEAHPADRALSVGAFSKAKAADSCAVGIRCAAVGVGGTAVGVDAQADGERSTAVGWNNGVAAEDGCAFGYGNAVTADAARSTALGNGVGLAVPDSVDVRAGSSGPRLFLSGRTGAAQISYLQTNDTPAVSTAPWGQEPPPSAGQFHIPLRMLAFRVNSAKTHLFIDVAVETTGGPVIRTASIPFL